MTRDEAFYAFGAAIGDQKCGLHFPELLRFGSLPKANALLPEMLEFVGRVAVAIGPKWILASCGKWGDSWSVCFARQTTDNGCEQVEDSEDDLSHAALLAALAALEAR